jgi:hypothetical protein
MRIFTVIAAAAGLMLMVAVAYAHEPPEWTSDVKDDGGPPAWVDDVKTDGGPPAFVGAAGGTANEDNEANVPDWVADVKADGGPPAWVEDVKADGGSPAWVEDVRTTPAAATAAAQKKAGH